MGPFLVLLILAACVFGFFMLNGKPGQSADYRKPVPLTDSEIAARIAARDAEDPWRHTAEERPTRVGGVEAYEPAGTKTPKLGELKAKRIWNASELTMFHRLSEALPDHIILSEVGYQAFLSAGTDKSLQGQIKTRRLDFVVLTQNGDFVAGIELDGSSHHNDKAAATDHRKNLLMASAGLKLVRWPADQVPKGSEIVQKVLG